MGLSHLSRDEIAAWVAQSCAASGVSVKVTDPTVVRRVGVLLGGAADGPGAQPRSGSARAIAARSVAPHDGHAGGVQHPGSGGAGSDHGVVDQGLDDGVLPGQVQGLPASA
jgi:hypothetical protein